MNLRVISAIVTAIDLTIVSAGVAVAQTTQQPTTQPGQPMTVQPTPATGTTDVAARRRSTLDAGVDLFAAADDGFGSESTTSTTDGTPVNFGSRSYWGANSNIAYQRASNNIVFGSTGSASVRRFSEGGEGLLPSYSGSMELSGRVGRRNRFLLFQSASYGPTNTVDLFGIGDATSGTPNLPLVDYRFAQTHQVATVSTANFTYNLSRRSSFTTAATFEWAQVPQPNDTIDEETITSPTSGSYQRWAISEQYTRQVSRYASWYAGYGLTTNNLSGSATTTTPRMHQIDLGLSYARPLSFSRRTHVAGKVGSQVVQNTLDHTREWRASGNASVEHEIGRTWRARLAYVRDSRFVAAFADPVLSDAVSGQLAGNLSRKSTLGLLANYSAGSVGLETGNNSYHGTSASMSYRYAFLRSMAVYAEYFLFDFSFDQGVPLTEALSSGTQRHGLRIGLSFATGLWGNQRRSPLTLDGDNAQ